jgi:Zn-dependent M28 family amino/carboxypeptidase
MVWTKRAQEVIQVSDAEMVFVGYGVVAPELGWNDYAGLDMTGKVAVILINDPDFETGDDRGFRGSAMTYYGRWTYKLEEAARQGAAGALIVHETEPAAYGWDVVQSSWSGAQHDVQSADGGASRVAVEGWVQEHIARDLLARAGLDFDAEKHRAQRPDFTPSPLGQSMSVSIETQVENNTSFNVAGVLRGRARANETIIYSAHWDHLGRCPPVDGDDICNGAADNATGVAGLIELARRFSNFGRLQRSVAFIAFTAEESGLLGSAHYAGAPLFAPASTVAAINMDGLGVDGPARDIVVVGSGQNELEFLLATAAREQYRTITPDPYPERGRYFRSDHFNFARLGIPALYAKPGLDLYIGGEARGRALDEAYVRERYHEPNDEVSPDWEYTGMIRDLMLLEQVGRGLAEGEHWPRWRRGSEFAPARVASRGTR